MLSLARSASEVRFRPCDFRARAKARLRRGMLSAILGLLPGAIQPSVLESGLGGEPDRGVGGAIGLVPAALDDFEKDALGERAAVELEVLGGAISVVKDVAACVALDELRCQAELRFQVGVVVVRNLECGQAVRAGGLCGNENVRRFEREVLHA